MRRNDPLSLGIEIGEREIRLVQIAVRGGRPVVQKTATEPLPPGAMVGGVPLEPGTVIVALRRALEAVGSPPSATFSVAGEQSVFRMIAVPPCPDSELSALVASEISHQNALNAGDAYGYFPIYPAEAGDDALRSLVVVGVDASLTHAIVEIAEGAGLTVNALEPAPLAALRTASRDLAADESSFILFVGSSYTDGAYFSEGRIAVLRRLDIGLDTLIQEPTMTPWDESLDEGFALDHEVSPPPMRIVDGEAVDRLAVEAQRTVDYVQRASRGAWSIERIRILGDDPQIEALGSMLERRLGIAVEVARAPGEASDARFGTAFGLAVRNLSANVALPTVDLFTAERSAAQRVETKRYFIGSLLVAGLSVFVGIVGCVLYNGQIAASRQRIAGVQSDTAKARQEADAAIEARADEELRDKTLRKEGVPLGALMDTVANSLDSGVGLKLITVGEDLAVRLQGEAQDETALVRTAQALKSSPVMTNVAVDRFDRDEKSLHGGVKFVLSAQTVSGDRLKVSERG